MRCATLGVAGLALTILLANLASSQSGLAPNVVPTDPLPPAAEKKAFRLPPGFEAQLVASEPDIHKPINLSFDDQGRLWVTDTLEYPFPAPPGKTPRDSVKVLSDFGPDGRARKVDTFADGLNIPIGILPLPPAKPTQALVYAIPNIYRFTDSTGGLRSDRRELLYGTYGFRDTHGMTSAFTWGFDGWVYACHGFSNTSTVKGGDGKQVTMNSGNTYRFRPDGNGLEQWTWGQVNPFGLTMDPLGNLYSADCHSQPIYQLLRGGYYPSFGKPHDGLGFAPEMFTGYKGSTAVCGITYYAADTFPEAYQGHCFVGDVMTNEIVLFRLTWHGSTPKAAVSTFLSSTDRWFRPVDIKLGPDGALYVADFYNRIIGHYEVPLTHPGRDRERGRIWRIVYTGKDHKGTPAPRADWARAEVKDLAGDLAHPNFAVRTKAANQLVSRGKEAVKPAQEALADRKAPAHQRAHALWVLERLGQLGRDELQKASKDEEQVRVHAMRVLSERGALDEGLFALALAGLKDASAHVQRAAADALGRHPRTENVRGLLDLRHKVPAADTHLLYVVRMALRDQLRPAGSYEKLGAGKEKLNEADLRALADVSLGVPSAESAHFLLRHIRHVAYPTDQLANFVHHVARYGDEGDARAVAVFARDSKPGDLRHQAALVQAVERGTAERGATLDEGARAWAVEVTGKLLGSKDDGLVRAGIELAGQLKLAGQQVRVVSLALDRARPAGQRAAACDALLKLDAGKYAGTLGGILTDAGSPVEVREHCARLLARGNKAEQREQLVRALPTVSARLQNTVAAELAGTPEGAQLLLKLVEGGKSSARLLQEKAVLVRLEGAKVPGLKERLEKLTAGLPAADKKLEDLLARRRTGYLAAKADAGRGAKVFEKHCASCHQVGGKGAKVGPQLDGIGLRGLERLLEDVLDPNRNVDQAFRTTTLTLSGGQIVSGLLLREEGAVLVLADSQGKEVRVAKKEVEERSVTPLSPMPANFADQVPEPEFYDLLRYLLAQQVVREEKR